MRSWAPFRIKKRGSAWDGEGLRCCAQARVGNFKAGNQAVDAGRTDHDRDGHDQNVAAKLCRSKMAVRSQRLLAGIPPVIEPSWSPEEDALLGKFTDREIGERSGRSGSGLLSAASNWEFHPFQSRTIDLDRRRDSVAGTMSDNEVAARSGHSPGSTKVKRLSLAIPAYSRQGE